MGEVDSICRHFGSLASRRGDHCAWRSASDRVETGLHRRESSWRRVSSFVRQAVCGVVIVTPAAAQRGGGPPVVVDPAASIDIIVRPVRNGSPDVQYAEIREHIVRSPGVTNAEFAVRVPGGPPGAAAPAGLEIVEMVDAARNRSRSGR